MQKQSHVGLHVKYPLLLTDFNQNQIALSNFSKLPLPTVLRYTHTIHSLIYQFTCQWTYQTSHLIRYNVFAEKVPKNHPAS
jgi:hypothetical protein